MQEHRLAAIMFTDIVGYTALMGSDEDLAFEVLHKNREIHSKFIKQYNGTLIKEMGDGILAQFNSAVDCVQCAIDIQRKARAELNGKLRIGIHLGDVTFEHEDVFGDGVNIASRLQSITDPGGIYISESLQKSIRGKSDIQTRYLGEFKLKNVDYPIKTYSIQAVGLPVPSKAKIKHLEGKGLKERIFGSVITYIVFLLLLVSSVWWIRNQFFSATSTITSLAILPFDNYTNDNELEYYVAGIHDILIGDVGKLGALHVISPRSSRAYKNVEKSILEIASELNVDAIVEGAILCMGEDSVCIQMKMYSTDEEEQQLWIQDYKEDKSQILNWNNRVTKAISDKINITLTPEQEKLLAESRTVNPDAQEAYFRGMSYLELGTKANLERAMDYFERAREIDPDYALAYHGIALVWGSYAQHGFMPWSEAYPKREVARKKALMLDSSLVEIRASLATEMTWAQWDWENAGKEFQKAIEINPNYAFVQAYYSHYLAFMGDPEEGLPHGDLAITLDPFNTLYQSVHGQALKNARKYDEALELLQKLYETEPDQGIGLPALWAVYHELGRYDDALEIAKKIYAVKGNDAAIESLEEGNREGGYKMAIQRTAEKMIAHSDTAYFPPWQICTLYCRAEMKEEALNWLEKAYEEHDVNMPFITVDPLFDFIRKEERFTDILQKMDLPV